MEGKEVRFGVVQNRLFADVTITFTTGSVNSMHDGFTLLGGMGAMMLPYVFDGNGVAFLAALVWQRRCLHRGPGGRQCSWARKSRSPRSSWSGCRY
jgi:hypothetical protein